MILCELTPSAGSNRDRTCHVGRQLRRGANHPFKAESQRREGSYSAKVMVRRACTRHESLQGSKAKVSRLHRRHRANRVHDTSDRCQRVPMIKFVRRIPRTFPRNALGASIGIAIAGVLTDLLVGSASAMPFLVAPIGASAVLVFAVPASPLARPWSVTGGNIISAMIGSAIAHVLPASALGASLAVGAAIAAMSLLRCLHPPGGACALTAVLVGPGTFAEALALVVAPVVINSLILVVCAVLVNRTQGRSYPHKADAVRHPPPPPITPQLTEADFDAVLSDYGEVLDISRKDLEMLYRDLARRAYASGSPKSQED